MGSNLVRVGDMYPVWLDQSSDHGKVWNRILDEKFSVATLAAEQADLHKQKENQKFRRDIRLKRAIEWHQLRQRDSRQMLGSRDRCDQHTGQRVHESDS